MRTLCITNLLSNLSFSVVQNNEIIVDLFLATQNQISNLSYVLEFINNQIKLEEIDRVFVTNGPGYFTTVRISCIVAQTISFLLKKELTFTDNFKALKNINKFLFEETNVIPVVKIASHRYRFKINNPNNDSDNYYSEASEIRELINIYNKERKKIIFNDFSIKELEILENEKVEFRDLSKIFRAGLVYLSSIQNLSISNDYNIRINY
ncbi:MAG: hypothetical protein RMJ36_01485 [Candidatus Calescibacterium sp.]|nr:hypothetical protein [Candidatus Calescibacterium sp.]MDW8132312.1 hypothetical protein [Candidatus Calescibacterium sp.]